MRRRLLSLCAGVLLGTSGMSAYEIGDYYYTETARWKVIDANGIPNGDFSNGMDGFVTDTGDPLGEEYFAVATGEGPDGGNCLKVLQTGGLGTGGSLLVNYAVTEPSYYLVTYKAKSPGAERTIHLWSGASNLQLAYVNSDGSTTLDKAAGDVYVTPEAGEFHYAGEWKEISFVTMVAETPKFLNIMMYNLIEDDCIADLGIYRIQQVGDDRPGKALLERMNYFLDNYPGFTEQRDMAEAARNSLETMLADPSQLEDPDAAAGMVKSIENEAFTPFLDANTVDMSRFFENFGFSKWIDEWQSTADRWYVNTEGNTTIGFDSGFLGQSISNGFSLNVGDVWQEVDLPAGEYMYKVRAAGNYCYRVDAGNKWGVVLGDSVQGMSFFLNEDTLVMDHVSPTYAKDYTLFSTVKEDGKVRIGVHSPGSPSKMGGDFKWDNIELRLISGKTKEEVEEYFFRNKVREKQDELTAMTDSASAATASDRYLYNKENLNSAVATANKVKGEFTALSQETVDTLVAQRAIVGDSIASFYKINAEYTALSDSIINAEKYCANEEIANGREALRNALDVAKAFRSSLTPEVRDSAAIVEQTAILGKAIIAMFMSNASYNNPVDVTGLIVNPNMAGSSDGWDVETDPVASWTFGSDAAFEGGYCTGCWTGNYSYYPKQKITQTLTLEHNGLYVFRCQARAFDQTTLPDPLAGQPTGCVFFAANETEGTMDSVSVATKNWEDIAPFTVRVLVTKAPVEVTFGFDAMNNFRANTYSYNSNTAVYYGDYDKYVQDSIAAITMPLRDSLQAVIDAAKTMRAEARNPKNVDTTPLQTAIDAAQAVVDKFDATADDLRGQFQKMTAATQTFMTSGVWPAEGKYYDLSFLLVNGDFTDETAEFLGWTMDGDAFGLNGSGEVSLYYGPGMTFSSSLTQAVSGLPLGEYQFRMSATYRYGREKTFVPDNYKDNKVMFLTVNDVRQPVTGLLAEGSVQEGGSWGLDVERSFTADEYYMGQKVWDMFAAGAYKCAVEFSVSSADAVTVGVKVEGIPETSFIFAKNPSIWFWGDKVADGIDSMVEDGAADAIVGDVYTLSGVKVRSNATSLDGLAKGVYIVGGKKYVVR